MIFSDKQSFDQFIENLSGKFLSMEMSPDREEKPFLFARSGYSTPTLVLKGILLQLNEREFDNFEQAYKNYYKSNGIKDDLLEEVIIGFMDDLSHDEAESKAFELFDRVFDFYSDFIKNKKEEKRQNMLKVYGKKEEDDISREEFFNLCKRHLWSYGRASGEKYYKGSDEEKVLRRYVDSNKSKYEPIYQAFFDYFNGNTETKPELANFKERTMRKLINGKIV